MFYATVILIMMVSMLAHGKQQCAENEEFYQCGPHEINCGELTEYEARSECLTSGCGCKHGYKRGPNGCQLPDIDCL